MGYKNLFLMATLSFISMYVLMYLMVDSYTNVYSNLNQLYMAGLMTMPMIVIELGLMGSMYSDKKRNALITLVSIGVGILLIMFIRNQVAITDREFLRSMIPHHAAALLMCKKAKIQDPEVKELCRNIGITQQSEIDFMKMKLTTIK